MTFDNHLFRASQSHHLAVGNIGVTIEQEKEIEELLNEQATGINKNGNKIKWTDNKDKRLKKLIYEKENPSIPKSMQSELRKIYRSTIYNRKFMFSNKYTQKGITHEEESFSTYQKWLKEVKGINFLLLNNKERINGEFFTGETDVNQHFYSKFNWGFDIKTSWSLETFPFKEDELDSCYKWQNHVYMGLIKEVQDIELEYWKTAYVLVNSSENILHNAKMSAFYNLDMHQSERNEEEYMQKCKDLEKLHIVDYDRFVFLYPGHDLVIKRKEWFDNNYDIPLKDRVVEKRVDFNQSKIDFITNRAKIGREYLNKM